MSERGAFAPGADLMRRARAPLAPIAPHRESAGSFSPTLQGSPMAKRPELTINVFRADDGYWVEFIGNAPHQDPWMHKHWHGETPVKAVENAVAGISAIAAGVGPKQNMYWVARHLMSGPKETT